MLVSKLKLNIAEWNVQTLLDEADNPCAERRTAVMSYEPRQYNIAGLRESHFSDYGRLEEYDDE